MKCGLSGFVSKNEWNGYKVTKQIACTFWDLTGVLLGHFSTFQYHMKLVLGQVPENPRTRTFKIKPDKPEPEIC